MTKTTLIDGTIRVRLSETKGYDIRPDGQVYVENTDILLFHSREEALNKARPFLLNGRQLDKLEQALHQIHEMIELHKMSVNIFEAFAPIETT